MVKSRGSTKGLQTLLENTVQHYVLAQANMFKTLPLRETQVNDTLSEIWPADVRSSCT